MSIRIPQKEKYTSDLIQQIKRNLELYQLDNSGMTLFKEFIQNADDSKAVNMHFGYSSGKENETDFWAGPSFFILNDGPFTPDDCKRIKSIGTFEKTRAKSQIGKFGLGLKSLHHWSELFFYFTYPEDEFSGIVNPWDESDDSRNAWMEISTGTLSRIEKIVSRIYEITQPRKTLFCIWMPLRSRARLNGRDAIKNNFAGDDDIARKILENEATPFYLAAILPMLKNLRCINGWVGINGCEVDPKELFSVSIPSNKLLPILDQTDFTTDSRESISIRISKKTKSLPIGGFLCFPNDNVLNEFRADDAWPKDEPNLVQHAGTYFVEGPVFENDKPQFSVSMSVFLPLGEPVSIPMEQSPTCSLPSVSLFLHGDFFVDSGRKKILSTNQTDIAHHTRENKDRENKDWTDDEVRMKWNDRLLEIGTLPLFLPALDCFVQKTGWNSEQIDLLTQTILKHRKKFSENIWKGISDEKLFGNFSWVCCYDHGETHWKLVESIDFLEIPKPNNLSLIEAVFPDFVDVSDSQAVIFMDSSRLTTKRAGYFSPQQLADLLQSVNPSMIFDDPDKIEYLLRFIENDRFAFSSTELIDLWNRIVHQLHLERLEDSILEYLKRIIRRIPVSKCLYLPGEKKEIVCPLARSLTLLDRLEIAIVPEFIQKDVGGAATLSTTDAVRLLKGLDTWKRLHKRSEDEYQDIALSAGRIWKAADDPEALEKECSGLILFRARNCSLKREEDFSYEELRRSYGEKNLFTFYGSTTGYAPQLQNALFAEQNTIVVLRDAVYHVLFSEDKRPCDPPNIVQYFHSKHPRLAAVENRFELFNSLLSGKVESRKYVLRYLIHGNANQYNSEEPLLIPQNSLSRVWSRLARLLWNTAENRWQILDPLTIDTFRDLRQSDKSKLGIEHLSTAEIIKKLDRIPQDHLEKFSSLAPDENEYEELLQVFQDYRHELCHAMPIHRTLDGRYVPIEEGTTFLEPKNGIAPELCRSIILLKRLRTKSVTIQREFIEELDEKRIVELVLKYSHPEKYWMLILDAIAHDVQALHANSEHVKTVKWLPVKNGGAAAMKDFICLPSMDGDIEREFAELPGEFYSLGDLWTSDIPGKGVRDHDGFARLKGFFPSVSESIKNLALFLLVKDDRNRIGYDPGDNRDAWLELFREGTGVFPCMPLLTRIRQRYPDEISSLVTELSESNSLSSNIPRVREILGYLSKTGNCTTELLDVYLCYLSFILSTDNSIELLEKGEIRLPNILGKWKKPTDLCDYHCEGITHESRLHQKVSEFLEPYLPRTYSLQSDENADFLKHIPGEYENLHNDKYAQILREYFKPWADFVFPEILGAFLSLCGGNKFIEQLAQEYLDKITLSEIRSRLFGGDERNAELKKKRIEFSISKGQQIETDNILGCIKMFQKQDNPDKIFVGNIVEESGEIGMRQGVVEFSLHDFPETDFITQNSNRLTEIIINSAHALCRAMFGMDDRYFKEGLEDFWGELKKSDENDITIFQNLFIKECHHSLDEHYSLLTSEMQDSIQSILSGKEEKERTSDQSVAQKIDEEIELSRQKIRDMLENDSTTQNSVLESTRKIIDKDCQYSVSSVPFELFQNADDAYLELYELDNSDRPCYFELREEPERLIVVHSGRRINERPQKCHKDSRDSRDINFRFGRDLYGMLGLHKSKKFAAEVDENHNPTGKFGLGFKSVFLLCDSPRILSGLKRRFHVVGGVYPVYLKTSEYEELVQSLAGVLSSPFQKEVSTLFELPFREDRKKNTNVLVRFKKLIHPLLVFSKRIRSCTINGNLISWNEKTLEIEGVGYASFDPFTASAISSLSTGLVFRSKHGSILFGLDSRGFHFIPKEVPTFWVMAPTEEAAEVGFLVNSSSFQIDVGRSRFTGKENNDEIAENLGQVFGNQLIQLFKLTKGDSEWSRLKKELNLLPDLERYDFWNSLWELLGEKLSANKTERAKSHAVDLLHKICWDSLDSGTRSLYARYPAIPSNLIGDFKKLVSLSEIQYALDGVLERDDALFKSISSWESFLKKVKPGSVISGRVHDALRSLGILDRILTRLDIDTVLQWECADSKIDSQKAESLGRFFEETFDLDRLSDQEQKKRIRELLNSLRFQTRDGGKFSNNSDLLAPYPDQHSEHQEENKRAEFAPESHLLHTAYQGRALDFFRLCRERMDANAQTLAEWGRNLEEQKSEKRLAFLRYLIKGHLGGSIGEHLKKFGMDWLNRLPESGLWARLSDDASDIRNCQSILAGHLGKTANWFPPPNDLTSDVPIQIDTKATLQRISNWWKYELVEKIALEKYLNKIYPKHIDMESLLNGDNRRAWVTLFLLGISHTMGRTYPAQHRSFLSMCDKKGWLDVFADAEYDSRKWMSVIEEYIEEYKGDSDQQEYMQWMKNFVGIYAVSRFLDDHQNSFMSIEKWNSSRPATEITRTRESLLQQRGGIDSVPISKSLGIGFCFIVRELVRFGKLTNQFSYEHCYVPTEKIRDLFRCMGCPDIGDAADCSNSKKIYKFLVEHLGPEDAIFDKYFDIPFHIILSDDQLKIKFGYPFTRF